MTPTKSNLNEHSEQLANTAVPPEKPDLTKLEESFGGPAPGSAIKDFLNSVPHGSVGGSPLENHQAVGQGHVNYDVDNNSNNVDSYPPLEHLTQTYGVPNYPSGHDSSAQNYENYGAGQDNVYQQPEPPQTTSLHSQQSHHFPGGHLSIQPNVEYPPLHVQQHIEYPPHSSPDALAGAPLVKPHHDDGMSVYASLTVDTEPQLAHLKIPSGYPGLYDPPKLQSHADFHSPHQFGQSLHHGGLTDGPLRIHLLDQLPPTHYWQGQGALAPTSALGAFNSFRKRDVLQRRTLAGRLARYSSLRSTRLHRL